MMGMDMLVKMILKALDLDQEKVIALATEHGKWAIDKIQNFDARLLEMELILRDLRDRNVQLTAQNQQFILLLKKAYSMMDIAEPSETTESET